MIRLEVRDYCQKCNHFKAAVEKPEEVEDVFGETVYYGHYVIRCKYRNICEDVLKIKEKENS